ncbi:MAG: TRAP transporter permease, partial [Clostridiales bacterium]|nr:TRAP transporter permease [Clostridiales bacterium]
MDKNKNPEVITTNEDILRKYDRESDFRVITGFGAKVIAAIAIAFSLFQLYTAVFGVLDAMIQRAIHVSFAFSLIYLLYPARKSWSRDKFHPIDVALAVIAAAVPMYIVVNYQELVLRAG